MEALQDPVATLTAAQAGDINAFEQLFSPFHAQLKAYLYRLTADRADAEDLAHDAFIRAYDRVGSFRGESSFKSWVFSIATRLAYDLLKTRPRWDEDVKSRAKAICIADADMAGAIERANIASGEAAFDVAEHISTCFTCMGKTLPIERQIALILKDIYAFSVHEIAMILEATDDAAKHVLQGARATMADIYDRRCALINKEGVCNQCSELNGWLNPKASRQQAITRLQAAAEGGKYDRDSLYAIRMQLIAAIDPLRGPGTHIQDVLLRADRVAMAEVAGM